jgi:aryl carrier-like protein
VDLIEHVRSTLPEYMCPSHFAVHATLPLTTSGKIDRTALAGWEAVAEPQPTPSEADLSPAEAIMAEIWREVLRRNDVTPDSDFFALGGDSLLAIRILAEAEDRGLHLQLVNLFRNPTLRGVCAGLTVSEVDVPPAGPDHAELVNAVDREKLPADVQAAMPATRLQLGMIFESLLSSEVIYLDVISREVTLPLREAALRQALRQIALRHPILRTRFDLATFSEPLQLVEPEPAVPLEFSDHTDLDPIDLAARHEDVMKRLAEPFDPEVAPLLRVHAARLGPDRYRLSYAFHHAVLDGWSESILALELLRTYHSALTGEPVSFEPPAPLAEFVRLEREALADERSRQYFARFAGTIRNAADERGVPRYRKESRTIPEDTAEALTTNAGTWGIPLKSQVFAAYYAAVAALWDNPTPVVGMSVNGRPEIAGADRTLGLFLNHVPVTLDPPAAGTWHALARQALDTENDVLPHRRFPYSEVRKLLGGRPFEVAFSYVHFHARNDLLDDGLVTVDEDVRDQTSLPVRVEVIDDRRGLGMSLDVTADEAHYGPGFAARLADRILAGIAHLATAPDTAPTA